MTEEDQKFQDEARDEIFDDFIKNNPDVDSSTHELIKKAISHTLTITEANFQGVLSETTSLAIRLPPDVPYHTGAYTSFTYTIADSPSHGRVVLLGGSRGTAVTDPVFINHYNTMKHAINNNPSDLSSKTKH